VIPKPHPLDMVANMPPGSEPEHLADELVLVGHVLQGSVIGLNPSDLYSGDHQQIVRWCLEQRAKGLPFNEPAAGRKFPSHSALIGDASVAAFEAGAPEGYVRLVSGRAHQRRELVRISVEAAKIRAAPVGVNGKPPFMVERVVASSIESKAIEWLVYPLIPKGAITSLSAMPGTGKSALSRLIAASLTRGEPLSAAIAGKPSTPGRPMVVDMIVGEESLEQVAVPQLRWLKADLARVNFLAHPTREIDLTTLHLDGIRERWKTDGVPDLLVVDPVSSLIPPDMDTNTQASVRQGLTGPLHHLVQETGVTILLVMHTKKGAAAGHGSLQETTMGSQEFVAGVRSTLHALVDRSDPEDDRVRLFLGKASFVKSYSYGCLYRLVDRGPALPPGVEWCGLTEESAEAFRAQVARGERGEGRTRPVDKAKGWVESALAQGRVEKREFDRLWLAEGLSEKSVSMARRSLGVVVSQEGRTWYVEHGPEGQGRG